jgi:trans-aconitate methyltransferase
MIENRRVILFLFEQNHSAQLLDCGCNDGEQTLQVVERIGTQRIYGIDIVDEYIDKAKAKGIEVYKSNLNQTLRFES